MGTAQRRPRATRIPDLASGGVVAKGMVRVGTMMPALEVLREHGVEVDRTLAEFGLDQAYLEDPDNTVPYAILGLFARRCAQLTRIPHFGLLVGRRLNASMIGPVGFLVGSAPNVRLALHELARHFHLHNPNATIDVLEDDDFVALRFTLLLPRMDGWEHILDGAIGTAFNLVHKLCGPGWEAIEVRLAHERPANVAPYLEFFGPNVRFNADESAVVFADKWLATPVATADPMLHLAMAKRVRELELTKSEDLVSQVRRMLPSLIAVRTGSISIVANLLGLSVRTLNRRLAEECTTFVRLRDEARHTAACQLLERTRLQASEISDRLGYSNPSAFTRAFERWSGEGPAEWRASRESHRARKRRLT